MYLGLYIYINDNRERELYSPICNVTSVHRRLGIHKFYSPVAKLEFSKSYTRNFNPFQNYSSDRIYETAYVCADTEKDVNLSSIPDVNMHSQ